MFEGFVVVFFQAQEGSFTQSGVNLKQTNKKKNNFDVQSMA